MVARQARGSAPKTCTLDGCDRPHRARGLCAPHYYAARATGDLVPIYNLDAEALCEIQGCTKARYARGRCKGHYDDGRSSGEFTEPCTVASCDKGAVSLGLCRGHVQRARRYNLSPEDLEALDKVTACENCGRPAEHVDHDHETGLVRGVLCRGCNTALGLLEDDRDRLYGLILYLDRYKDSLP